MMGTVLNSNKDFRKWLHRRLEPDRVVGQWESSPKSRSYGCAGV